MKTRTHTLISRALRSQPCISRLAIRHRYFSTTPSALSDLPSTPPFAGFARLTNRALISIHGRDAAHYLQGLTTANIKNSSSSSQAGFYSSFLNAQGRVLHDVFVYPIHHSADFREETGGENYEEPAFLIDVDKSNVENLRAHLKRYKLRAKIALRVIDPGEWDVWGIWGVDDATPSGTDTTDTRFIGCTDARAPGMGRRILTSNGQKPTTTSDQQTSVETYDIRRILKGVPQGHSEIVSGEGLPQESNIDYMGGIDFRKGCYVGQELTIRTHHTGVVRKRILPVQVYGMDEKPPDTLRYDPATSIELPDVAQNIARVNTRGRSAGKWLSGMGNIGLALCRLETMTDVRLTEEGSQWSPEHEFKMSWQPENGGEKELKIKAFVPKWHRNRISVRDMHRQNSNET